jgi:hypothetical protein
MHRFTLVLLAVGAILVASSQAQAQNPIPTAGPWAGWGTPVIGCLYAAAGPNNPQGSRDCSGASNLPAGWSWANGNPWNAPSIQTSSTQSAAPASPTPLP